MAMVGGAVDEAGRAGRHRPNAAWQRTRRVGARVFVAIALIAAFATLGSAAEPQRVEVVGSYPIRESLRSKVNPRDEAIQRALWEGVSRIALELIGEEGPATEGSDATEGVGTTPAVAPDPSARFRKVFGSHILPYTRSFRILEDRGEHPVLFSEDPGVRSEYLVVVDVVVDVDRVRGELARAGLLEPSAAGPETRRSVTLELVGIRRYTGLQRVLETLRHQLGASKIETLELAPARQVLRLESPLGADELAARLGRLESPELILDPVEVDPAGGRIRVLAQWLEPLPEAEAVEPGDVPATIQP